MFTYILILIYICFNLSEIKLMTLQYAFKYWFHTWEFVFGYLRLKDSLCLELSSIVMLPPTELTQILFLSKFLNCMHFTITFLAFTLLLIAQIEMKSKLRNIFSFPPFVCWSGIEVWNKSNWTISLLDNNYKWILLGLVVRIFFEG